MSCEVTVWSVRSNHEGLPRTTSTGFIGRGCAKASSSVIECSQDLFSSVALDHKGNRLLTDACILHREIHSRFKGSHRRLGFCSTRGLSFPRSCNCHGSSFFRAPGGALVAKRSPARRQKGLAVLVANVQATSFNEAKLQQDYAATASDAGVLQRPLKEELRPADVRRVFGFPRDLRER